LTGFQKIILTAEIVQTWNRCTSSAGPASRITAPALTRTEANGIYIFYFFLRALFYLPISFLQWDIRGALVHKSTVLVFFMVFFSVYFKAAEFLFPSSCCFMMGTFFNMDLGQLAAVDF